MHSAKCEASFLAENWTSNSFKTKAVGFCKRATDVAVVKFFIKFLTAREPNDRQTVDWMNSIKFKASLLAIHWKYQTLHEGINVSVVIFSIEKYKLKLNQALIFSAQTLLVSSSS